MDRDFLWLRKNGFTKIANRWTASDAERDYVDNTYTKYLNDAKTIICRMTYLYKEDKWEAEVYAEALGKWLSHLEVKTSTAQTAYNAAVEKWRNFITDVLSVAEFFVKIDTIGNDDE